MVIPVERGGNAEPCAVLLVKNSDRTVAGAAIEKASSSLAEYQRIRTWIVWPDFDFPRTPTGKPRLSVISSRATQILDGRRMEGPENVGVDFSPASSARGTIDGLLERFRRVGSQERELVRWLRLAVYYALVWPATQILGHPHVVGRENLRGLRGPILIVSNHITRRADIGLILAALPARFRHRLATAMGGETLQEMRNPPRDWFFARRWTYQLGYWLVTLLFNVFPLPQLSGFRESFRFAGESADRGYSVLVFPEGEVNNSEDGRMAPFQGGIGLLADGMLRPYAGNRRSWKAL